VQIDETHGRCAVYHRATACEFLQTAFYNTTLSRYAPAGREASNELLLQSLNVAPLAMARSRPDVAASLSVDGLVQKLHQDVVARDYHLSVGSVGAKHLLPQLSANGLHVCIYFTGAATRCAVNSGVSVTDVDV
jgi:hypothetical protein